MTSQYQRVADDLRVRLGAREWQIGQQIPPIAELQDQYDIRSLNTIRQAQQVLIEEGLLRAEQGRGVYVTAYPGMTELPDSDRHAAAITAIDQAVRALATARAALTGEAQ